MFLSLQIPAQMFFRALTLSRDLNPAALVARWQARAAEGRAEKALASLPPHVLVDIGVVSAQEERPVSYGFRLISSGRHGRATNGSRPDPRRGLGRW